MTHRATLAVAVTAAVSMVLLAVFLPSTWQAYRKAESASEFTWSASGEWAVCAETAQDEGVILAARIDNRLYPAADVSLADDIGHNLFLGIASMWTGRPLRPSDCARFNVLVNCLGVLVVLQLLMAARFRIAGLAFAALSPLCLNASTSTGPHPSHTGAAMLALACAVSFSTRSWTLRPGSMCEALAQRPPRVSRPIWKVAGAVAGACATLIRGIMAAFILVATVGTSAVAALARMRSGHAGWRPAVLRIGASACIILALSGTGWAMLRVRDVVWRLPAAKHVEGHGVSHNLTIGLGVDENSLGVRWNDACGLTLARSVDPNVEYVTRDYYNALWKVYLGFWRDHPGEVLRIYAAKVRTMLSEAVFGRIPMWAIVVLAAIIAVAGATRRGIALSPNVPHFLVLVPAFILVILYNAQGVAARPSQTYWLPVEGLSLVMLAVTADMIARLPFRESAPTDPAGNYRDEPAAVQLTQSAATIVVVACAGMAVYRCFASTPA